MSDESDDKSHQELSSSETQTPIGDNCGEDYGREELSLQTLPSLLQSHCSFPTELFYTLSPISLSRIASESTPIVNRSEPIGGEDRHQRLTLLRTIDIQTNDLNDEQMLQSVRSGDNTGERPPLIGRTNSTSGSSLSTALSTSQKSDDQSIGVVSREDRDALAAKVRQLLGRTKPPNNEDFECESLGLIHEFDLNSSVLTIDSLRSEPDGKGKPFVSTQTAPKIVYYSSSESEEEEEVSDTTSQSTQRYVLPARDNQNVDTNSRLRSYSLSSGKGVKSSGFDISSILRQRLQTKNNFVKENCETQTNRSFLAERAVHNEEQTSVKRRTDTSKGIQTSDSLLQSFDQKKDLKESSSQTNTSYNISLLLKELLKTHQNSLKVSAGTQTLRSYLTEQSLKRKSRENKEQNRQQMRPQTLETQTKVKAIQTSYTSSCTSNSPVIVNRIQDFDYPGVHGVNSKEPISWFISVDNKHRNRNITQTFSSQDSMSRTITKRRTKPKETITDNMNTESLQEAFNRRCVDMRMNSQIRVNRIQTIADIRKQTADERLIQMAKQFLRQHESAKVIKTNVIQPVFQSSIRRFFTHEEMRAQTEKVYNNLPEVKAMREKKKQKERETNQRLLAQIYKYKLKDNALKGRLTWKITQSCLN